MSNSSTAYGPAGNYYPKYATKNWVARQLVARFLRRFDELCGLVPAEDVLEVGCGEGHLSLRLAQSGKRVRGVDISPQIVQIARHNAQKADINAQFGVANIYDLDEASGAPLIICCEVLEHLPDPSRALAVLSRLASPYAVLSVPREPLWRVLNLARGAYVARLGNTPGHVQHWSKHRFVQAVEEHFEVLEVRTPIPWTLVLCRSLEHPHDEA